MNTSDIVRALDFVVMMVGCAAVSISFAAYDVCKRLDRIAKALEERKDK